jgi:hypothetical protein
MSAKKTPASKRARRRTSNDGTAAGQTVENVNHPGGRRLVDAAMYRAMRQSLLKVIPRKSPGLTLAELSRAVMPHLPASLFPGGAKAGWWLKTVQLDLEAKRIIVREKTRPLRLHRSLPGR